MAIRRNAEAVVAVEDPTPSTRASTCEPPCHRRSSVTGSSSIPPDPVRLADTRTWLLRAQEDRRGAEIDLASSAMRLSTASLSTVARDVARGHRHAC